MRFTQRLLVASKQLSDSSIGLRNSLMRGLLMSRMRH
jgi:hypothetical protein